jgi:hypothetical protein
MARSASTLAPWESALRDPYKNIFLAYINVWLWSGAAHAVPLFWGGCAQVCIASPKRTSNIRSSLPAVSVPTQHTALCRPRPPCRELCSTWHRLCAAIVLL